MSNLNNLKENMNDVFGLVLVFFSVAIVMACFQMYFIGEGALKSFLEGYTLIDWVLQFGIYITLPAWSAHLFIQDRRGVHSDPILREGLANVILFILWMITAVTFLAAIQLGLIAEGAIKSFAAEYTTLDWLIQIGFYVIFPFVVAYLFIQERLSY